MEMTCKRCGNNKFLIGLHQCCSCEYNGAWRHDEREYIYESLEIKTLDLERDQVSNDGECELGRAYGRGCYNMICAKCGVYRMHIPLTDT